MTISSTSEHMLAVVYFLGHGCGPYPASEESCMASVTTCTHAGMVTQPDGPSHYEIRLLSKCSAKRVVFWGVAPQDDPALLHWLFFSSSRKTKTCTRSICLCIVIDWLARNGMKRNASTSLQIVLMNTTCGCNNLCMCRMCFVWLGWEGLI